MARMLISQHLKSDAVSLSIQGNSITEVLGELADLIAASHKELDPQDVREALIQREKLVSTASGEGIAFPHCYCKIKSPRFALGISKHGIDAEAPDGNPVHIFLVVVSPDRNPNAHLEALSAASRLFIEKEIREEVKSAMTEEEIVAIIAAAERLSHD